MVIQSLTGSFTCILIYFVQLLESFRTIYSVHRYEQIQDSAISVFLEAVYVNPPGGFQRAIPRRFHVQWLAENVGSFEKE